MLDTSQLNSVIKQNELFLDMAQRTLDAVRSEQESLLLVSKYHLDINPVFVEKMRTESYCAQAGLCSKLSALLTGPYGYNWPDPKQCSESAANNFYSGVGGGRICTDSYAVPSVIRPDQKERGAVFSEIG